MRATMTPLHTTRKLDTSHFPIEATARRAPHPIVGQTVTAQWETVGTYGSSDGIARVVDDDRAFFPEGLQRPWRMYMTGDAFQRCARDPTLRSRTLRSTASFAVSLSSSHRSNYAADFVSNQKIFSRAISGRLCGSSDLFRGRDCCVVVPGSTINATAARRRSL